MYDGIFVLILFHFTITEYFIDFKSLPFNLFLMHTFKLPCYPLDQVHIALYINIKNIQYIKNLVVSGDLGFQCAFIDASTVSLNTKIC